MLDKIYDYSVHWQMSPHERASFLYVLDQLEYGSSDGVIPCAIEVGTYCGGTLRHIIEKFQRHRVDILDLTFERVHFNIDDVHRHTGKSSETLGGVIDFYNSRSEYHPSFILIDADHEYDSVLTDLANVMRLVPKRETVVLIHDSWYPPSRKAIQDTKFSEYVRFVDLDFCSGSVLNGMPIGGMAYILMSPEGSGFEMRSSESHTYDALLRGANG
jgi:hypothetical protein